MQVIWVVHQCRVSAVIKLENQYFCSSCLPGAPEPSVGFWCGAQSLVYSTLANTVFWSCSSSYSPLKGIKLCNPPPPVSGTVHGRHQSLAVHTKTPLLGLLPPHASHRGVCSALHSHPHKNKLCSLSKPPSNPEKKTCITQRARHRFVDANGFRAPHLPICTEAGLIVPCVSCWLQSTLCARSPP